MFKLISVCLMISLLEMSLAQRPSFAGARPPGGLTQKDKYHGTQNTAVENITGVDIANRFGADAVPQQAQTIDLAFGAVQRPPIGVPLVWPTSGFVPDQVPVSATAVPAAAAFAAPSIANRFGTPDISSSPNPTASTFIPIASSSIPSTSSSFPSTNLPIDAHGDREFVNYLSQLPADKQPFWFLNYQAIEALRNSSRPNVNALETRGSFFGG